MKGSWWSFDAGGAVLTDPRPAVGEPRFAEGPREAERAVADVADVVG